MESYEHIKAFLNEPKRRELISLKAIEEKAGIPPSTLSKWLRNERELPKRHLFNLIDQLKYLGYGK